MVTKTPWNVKLYLTLGVPFAFMFFLPLVPLVMIEKKSVVGGLIAYYNFWNDGN